MPTNASLTYERAHKAIFYHADHIGPSSACVKCKAHPKGRTGIALRVCSLPRPLSSAHAYAGDLFSKRREMHVNGSFPQAGSDPASFLICTPNMFQMSSWKSILLYERHRVLHDDASDLPAC